MDADAQRIAFEACRDAGRVFETRRYATRWRKLAPANAMGPDLALAEALLLAGDFDGVLQAIGPHREHVSGTSGEANRLLVVTAEASAALGESDTAFSVIEPRLPRSAAWREIAIRLASERVRDLRTAWSWLEAVETHLELQAASIDLTSNATPELSSERLRLARGWSRLGSRLGSTDALERGRKLLQSLTAGPLKQDPDAWSALAETAAWSDQPSELESACRRALALDPRQGPAANRLARLLLGAEDSFARAEALTWARVAAEQDPIEPEYQDALARAHRAVNDEVQARAAFERALRLDDSNLDAMLGLADLLLRAGETETASLWFTRLEPAFARTTPPDARLQREFESLSRRFAPPQR
jgi:tetratricopeptide (TPR) repeat protein